MTSAARALVWLLFFLAAATGLGDDAGGSDVFDFFSDMIHDMMGQGPGQADALDAPYQAQAPACTSDIMKGAFDVRGLPGPFYMAGGGGNADGGRLTIQHNAGFSLFSKCETQWAPESITQLSLLGKSISFTVDLSSVGCACNLAVYLISSPARGWDGNYNPGTDRGPQPAYYCDANNVGGQWCPEIDLMEANNHALQATPHRCNAPKNGHYSSCDRGGCAQNTKNMHNAYGPGSQYTIDTRSPFQLQTDFPEENGALIGMRTTLRQGGREVVLAHDGCNRDYLAALSDALKTGMSLRITYWGDSARTMGWMDMPVCGQDSCSGGNAGTGVISDMSITPPETSDVSVSTAPPAFAGPGVLPPWSVADTPAASSDAGDGVANAATPWVCHLVQGNEEEHAWCQTAGVQGDYEFAYNGGVNSPCDGCWCCKRVAVRESAADGTNNGDVWVVSAIQDSLYGQQVPKEIIADPSRFTRLGSTGVVNWRGERHFVKEALRPEGSYADATFMMRKAEEGSAQAMAAGRGRETLHLDFAAIAALVSAATLALAVGAAGMIARRRRLRRSVTSLRDVVAGGGRGSAAALNVEAAEDPEEACGGTTPIVRSQRAASLTAVPAADISSSELSPFLGL